MRSVKLPLALSSIAVLILAATSVAQAGQIHVDPQAGSDTGDGSSGSPYRSAQKVIDGNLFAAGDTIVLHEGYHGALSIKGKQNSAQVVVAAAPSASARLARVVVNSSRNWTLRELDISPSHAPTFSRQTMVDIQSGTESIVVEDCLLRTVDDSSGWSASDWDTKACNGINFGGTKHTIRGNHLKNVNFGIGGGGTHSLIQGNVIENFSGDGLRGLGDYTTFEGNTVKNCYDVNANHDDGFQSWTIGSDGKVGTGQVVGVVLRGNRFINYTDPNQPHRGTLQGIGMFDGTFVDWVIENNVVITDHWHGITLMGAKNCRVVNNTVIDVNSASPGPPWISVTNHKNGTAPTGCLVRNNLATDFKNASSGVTEDHNIKIAKLDDHFVDAASHDLRLLASSSAVDSGSATQAPTADIDGVARPQGQGVDVGAHEHTTGTPPAPDAGTPPDPDTGTQPDPDTGTSPDPDTGTTPDPDTGSSPDPDTGTSPDPDTGTSPDPDTGAQPGSDGGASPKAGGDGPPADRQLVAGCALGGSTRAAPPWLGLLLGLLALRRRRCR